MSPYINSFFIFTVLTILTLPILSCGENSTGSNNNPGIDDEFNGDLSVWSVLNKSAATVYIEAGQLVIEPLPDTLWYNSDTGVLVYQLVRGNFMVSAYLTSRKASSNDELPVDVNLGGLMAHNPNSTSPIQDYVHVAIGALTVPVAENKTTINGNSVFSTTSWPNAEAEIRICRVGDNFTLFVRERDSIWQTLATYNRPDLPQTLQVGAMAYSDTNADLRVSFEYIRFQKLPPTNECNS